MFAVRGFICCLLYAMCGMLYGAYCMMSVLCDVCCVLRSMIIVRYAMYCIA